VGIWKTRWENGDKLGPRLELMPDLSWCVILDSRSGEPIQYTLPEPCIKMLRSLSSAQSFERIQATFQASPACDFESAIKMLRERGLVFEDSGHLVSLVLTQGFPRGGAEYSLSSTH
jgi:hypothetical protein